MNRSLQIKEAVVLSLTQNQNLLFILESVPDVKYYEDLGLRPPEPLSRKDAVNFARLKKPRPTGLIGPAAEWTKRALGSFGRSLVGFGPGRREAMMAERDVENALALRTNLPGKIEKLKALHAPEPIEQKYKANIDKLIKKYEEDYRKKTAIIRHDFQQPMDPAVAKRQVETRFRRAAGMLTRKRDVNLQRAADTLNDELKRAEIAQQKYPLYTSRTGRVAGRVGGGALKVGAGLLAMAALQQLKHLYLQPISNPQISTERAAPGQGAGQQQYPGIETQSQ